ncbi:hypothetical protein ACO2Q2_00425 [Dyella sp. KRB-257]|uniref:hypothetical protein n=1 Tax=Dyella sp. KRB-257 TaxID=3400915 RepID=UPI003C07F90E
MRKDRPREGGIALVLQLIGGVALLGAFLGGALANLSLGGEIMLMIATFVASCLLWAGAAVIEELRRIEFNTRGVSPQCDVIISNPLPSVPTEETIKSYGITREGDRYLFDGYFFEDAIEAVNYAKSRD